MRRFRLASLVLIVALGAALAINGVALAQQPVQFTSYRVESLPLDPASPVWPSVKAYPVSLTAQTLALPRQSTISIPTVRVRSVNDGQKIAFHLEWFDATRNARATQPDEFRDAAALMFPLGDVLPNICMGTPGQMTNIWHWKADWQEDIDKGFQDIVDSYPNFFKDSYPFVTGRAPFRMPADFAAPDAKAYFPGMAAGNPLSTILHVSPVEEVVSIGFGTLTHKAAQAVDGKGIWKDSQWQVTFSRQLAAPDPEGANLTVRDIPVAFAVWDGANQEVGARKQLSNYVTTRISADPLVAAAATPASPREMPPWQGVLILALVIPVAAGGIGWWARWQSVNRRGN
ncbi:MAG: hypothetical protein EPO26_17085 [Chloroflexota bacterium]|nr:MAG: hypothetical protein EPO26_17085 [Chloroflexota bacterium]